MQCKEAVFFGSVLFVNAFCHIYSSRIESKDFLCFCNERPGEGSKSHGKCGFFEKYRNTKIHYPRPREKSCILCCRRRLSIQASFPQI